MLFSEADQRTVLQHLEAIRDIIRGVKPETLNGYYADPNSRFVLDADTNTDDGAARQAAETASR